MTSKQIEKLENIFESSATVSVRQSTDNCMLAVTFDSYKVKPEQGCVYLFNASGAGGYLMLDASCDLDFVNDGDGEALIAVHQNSVDTFLIECASLPEDEEEFYVTQDAVDKLTKGIPEDEYSIDKCPICGCNAHAEQTKFGKWYMVCNYCPLETASIFGSREEAIDYWNDRRELA